LAGLRLCPKLSHSRVRTGDRPNVQQPAPLRGQLIWPRRLMETQL